MNILVTGAAGFIGYHVAKRLAKEGHEVVGLDNLNNYYDVKLKLDRLQDTGIDPQKIAYNEPVVSDIFPNYTFVQLGIEDAANLERLFARHKFEQVCHLAAQAGVRYSIKHPEAYVQSNIVGFFNVLESCRHHHVKHFVFASSSSVYGDSQATPSKVTDSTDAPISFYAATKKSNELMAHTYSHLYNLHTTGLRFFTAYGPWGRPDMATAIFTKAILENKPIMVFNQGNIARDFTFIDDIVENVVRILGSAPQAAGPNTNYSPSAPFRIYNIGNSVPTAIKDFIVAIEEALNLVAIKEYLPMQPGDAETTSADITELVRDFEFQPQTSVKEGIASFVRWYLDYNKIPSN